MLIMTYAAKSLSSPLAGVTRLVVRSFRSGTKLLRAIHHRRQVARLSEMSDRELKDIGLARSDVSGALAVSWLQDPSSVLVALSSVQHGAAAARREDGVRQAEVTRVPAAPAVAAPSKVRPKVNACPTTA